MKNNIMSFVEIDTMNRNINMIESRLGYKLPGYAMNTDELKSDIMSLSEVDTYARNVDMMNLRRGITPTSSGRSSLYEIYDNLFHLLLFIGLAVLIIYGTIVEIF